MNNLQFQKTGTVYPRTTEGGQIECRLTFRLQIERESSNYRGTRVVIVTMSKFPAVFGAARPLRHNLPRRGIPVIAGAATPDSINESRKRVDGDRR